jgi:C1A family cysteine protease
VQCGSCWAFAATAAIESKLLIQQAKLMDLSEQNFVDCVNAATDPAYYSDGCNGGWPTHALNYAYRWNQTTEALYPYK